MNVRFGGILCGLVLACAVDAGAAVVEPAPPPAPRPPSNVELSQPATVAPRLPGVPQRSTEPSPEPVAAPQARREHLPPPVKPIGQLSANVALPRGSLPEDDGAVWAAQQEYMSGVDAAERGFPGTGFYWQATDLCFQPLYFQDESLERYGYTFGPLQPAVSAAKFFATIPALPYLMGAAPPRECVYTLGYARPGSNVPYRRNRVPLSARGALLQGAAVTGAVFAIP